MLEASIAGLAMITKDGKFIVSPLENIVDSLTIKNILKFVEKTLIP